MKRELTEERKEKLKQVGLHYCKLYENVVRWNEPACSKCEHATYPRKKR